MLTSKWLYSTWYMSGRGLSGVKLMSLTTGTAESIGYETSTEEKNANRGRLNGKKGETVVKEIWETLIPS